MAEDLDRYERSCYLSPMNKGADTKTAILATALDMASRLGLENVTIGALAKATGMSKSGLFAHFQSKENLQIEILEFAGESFSELVVAPALRTKAGVPRIKALVENWIVWGSKLSGGCIFVSASTEFSERPGKVRDFLIRQQRECVYSLCRMAKAAVREGDFREGIDCEQFAFEFYSLLLGFYYYHQLLQDSDTKKRQEIALERLLADYGWQGPTP